MYIDNSINKYLNDLSAKKPTPGGGSVAALAGALAVGLISMVSNFTVGNVKYKNSEGEIKGILFLSETLRKKLGKLIDEDVTSYEKVSKAYKLPHENPDDKRKREQAIQITLKEAVAVPVEVCNCCYEAIKLCPVIAEKGNINLISDVGVAVSLLESAFQSALLNVDINLNSIKDKEFIVKIRKVLEPLEEEVSAIKDEIWQVVKGRMLPDKEAVK